MIEVLVGDVVSKPELLVGNLVVPVVAQLSVLCRGKGREGGGGRERQRYNYRCSLAKRYTKKILTESEQPEVNHSCL